MGQVFIRYSRRATKIVDRMVGQMHEAGLHPWIDREDYQIDNLEKMLIM